MSKYTRYNPADVEQMIKEHKQLVQENAQLKEEILKLKSHVGTLTWQLQQQD